MTDFKVGDWVKVKKVAYDLDRVGDIAKVTYVGNEIVIINHGDALPEHKSDRETRSYHWTFSKDEVEKLEVKSLRDLDLKVGDKVTLIQGVDLSIFSWSNPEPKEVYCNGNNELAVWGIPDYHWGNVYGIWGVERAEVEQPKKMHPDDFYQAVTDFAEDNGFKVNNLSFYTQDNLYVQGGI